MSKHVQEGAKFGEVVRYAQKREKKKKKPWQNPSWRSLHRSGQS
jgi:hypothetical protein